MIPSPIQRHRIEATLQLQFPNLDTSNLLENISIEVSRKTKRIRSVYNKEGELIFSLRVLDGHFIPTIEGAKEIFRSGYSNYRIVMNEEASPFVAKGKTAFCKHVVDVDSQIVPNSEVFLVDEQNQLLAVGSALHPGYAILELENGPAVKVRHGIE